MYLIGLTVADVEPEIRSSKQVEHHQVVLAGVLLLLLLRQEVLGKVLKKLDRFFTTVHWRAGSRQQYT